MRHGVLCLLIDRAAYEAVFDLRDVHVAEIVDEIAPRVGGPADPRDKGHDPADFQPTGIDRPSADQERADNLQLSAEVHQEVHRELELVDPHVELKDVLDAFLVGTIPRLVAAPLDDADAELADDLNPPPGSPGHRAPHPRHAKQPRD